MNPIGISVAIEVGFGHPDIAWDIVLDDPELPIRAVGEIFDLRQAGHAGRFGRYVHPGLNEIAYHRGLTETDGQHPILAGDSDVKRIGDAFQVLGTSVGRGAHVHCGLAGVYLCDFHIQSHPFSLPGPIAAKAIVHLKGIKLLAASGVWSYANKTETGVRAATDNNGIVDAEYEAGVLGVEESIELTVYNLEGAPGYTSEGETASNSLLIRVPGLVSMDTSGADYLLAGSGSVADLQHNGSDHLPERQSHGSRDGP